MSCFHSIVLKSFLLRSATIATIDTCMWAATGHMEDDLSEQHLMDCANGHTYYDTELVL